VAAADMRPDHITTFPSWDHSHQATAKGSTTLLQPCSAKQFRFSCSCTTVSPWLQPIDQGQWFSILNLLLIPNSISTQP